MFDLPTQSMASPAPADDRTVAVIVADAHGTTINATVCGVVYRSPGPLSRAAADYLRLLLGHDRLERVQHDPERLTDYAALADASTARPGSSTIRP